MWLNVVESVIIHTKTIVLTVDRFQIQAVRDLRSESEMCVITFISTLHLHLSPHDQLPV